MAAVLGVGKTSLKGRLFNTQLLKLVPIAQGRFVSDTGAGSGQKAANKKPKEEPKQHTSYKVPEYYSHNKDTFADLEIEMASLRQAQPDPRVPYYHHYPWEKKSS